MSEPPVRLCCGQRHSTVTCPDGLTMCCLCFERFPREQLHTLEDGCWEDVCVACAEQERRAVEERESG